MTVSILCLLLTVLWVGMQCEIVTFPGHTHLLFMLSLSSIQLFFSIQFSPCSISCTIKPALNESVTVCMFQFLYITNFTKKIHLTFLPQKGQNSLEFWPF